jgi:hypothetical protein
VYGLVGIGYPFEFYNVDCPLFFGNYCENNRFATSESLADRNLLISRIETSDQTVIFSEVLRYSRYEGVRDMERDVVVEFESEDDWLGFISERIGEFRSIFPDRKIIWIGETPRVGFKFDPRDCLSRMFQPPFCRETPIERHREWRAINLELAKIAERNGILFFDPHEFLCDEFSCLNSIGYEVLYSDYHHFSIWGSELMVRNLRAHLESGVPERRLTRLVPRDSL